ncbi:MAG TPA: hypothetical protein VNK23_12375 [Candidatus Dormibacteraeota bacterium]|nr:hypothetical protein [Candidatus Dormibacteraeota bacterium]
MRLALRRTICGIAFSVAAIPCARAQSAKVPPDVRAFAAQYVAAINAKDVTRIRSYFVPQARACITPENKEVYDSVLAMQLTDHIPQGYTLTSPPVNLSNLKALSDVQYLPVKPERELRIDYRYPGTTDGGVVVLWLARRNGRWMDDHPCITAHGLKIYRENAAAREHYQKLAKEIKEPLRAELIGMLRARQTSQAEFRYHQATGSDLQTSMLVINALQEQLQ